MYTECNVYSILNHKLNRAGGGGGVEGLNKHNTSWNKWNSDKWNI